MMPRCFGIPIDNEKREANNLCYFSVSPRSKSFFFLFWGTLIRLGDLLGQGLGLGLGPGLDNLLETP